MLAGDWSLKAEAIYWNMGNMNVSTSTVAQAAQPGSCVSPGDGVANISGFGCAATNPSATIGTTQVNYQGAIARIGINYHINFDGI